MDRIYPSVPALFHRHTGGTNLRRWPCSIVIGSGFFLDYLGGLHDEYLQKLLAATLGPRRGDWIWDGLSVPSRSRQRIPVF